MSQLVYTFFSPKSVDETKIMIRGAISQLNGKVTKEDGNVIKAKWRGKRFTTWFPLDFTFYVGVDMVRVIRKGAGADMITHKRGGKGGIESVWDDFVQKLCELNPAIDFGVKPGLATIESIKFMNDGVEQVYTTSTIYRDSIFGGLSYGATTSKTQISDKLLAAVRYTNGATFEAELSKKSSVYHEVMANMSKYER